MASPTVEDEFEKLLGPGATAEQRFQYSAYAWAGLTEFWRAHRNFAGVLHFVYLTSSYPEAFTSDHFADIRNLRLEPNFEDYMREAFKPLGVYINFWQPRLAADSQRRFLIMMINDEGRPAQGRLALALENESGTMATRSEVQFAVPAFGQQSYNLDLHVPPAAGKYILKATAYPMGGTGTTPTLSRRKIAVQAAEQAVGNQ